MPFYRRTHTFTHKRFYTQTLLHTDTDAFPHRAFYTQTLFHTDPFTHRRFYTQTLSHKHFYTQTLLHTDTDAFPHRPFYTQTLLHKTFTHTHTQRLLHTDAFTGKHFCTQFTHRRFSTLTLSTQTLLHTNTFTHRRFHRDFYTETLTKRGTTGWPQLQTKVRKHSCNVCFWNKKIMSLVCNQITDEPIFDSAGKRNGNAQKSQKCTRSGSVPDQRTIQCKASLWDTK